MAPRAMVAMLPERCSICLHISKLKSYKMELLLCNGTLAIQSMDCCKQCCNRTHTQYINGLLYKREGRG